MKKRNGSKRTMVVMMTAAMAASMGITGMAAGDSGDTITLTWLNHYAEAGKQAWLQSHALENNSDQDLVFMALIYNE